MPNQRQIEKAHGLELTGLEPRTLQDLCRFLGIGGHDEFVAPGRGPGNGVQATAYGMAKLCLVAWAGVPAYRAADAFGPLFCTPVSDSPQSDEANLHGFNGEDAVILKMQLGVCPITKVCTWGEALCALFASSELADRVSHIVIRRHPAREAIIFGRDGTVSRLCADGEAMAADAADGRGACRRLTVVGGAIVATVARTLQS